ncbi:MAG: tyrosine-type recombinase/integrase [Candidatus Odinarchaeota archaeon]
MKITASKYMNKLDKDDRDAMIAFLKEKLNVKPVGTVKCYQTALRSFAEFLVKRKKSLHDISEPLVIEFIQFLSVREKETNSWHVKGPTLSPGSIRTRIFNLKSFYYSLAKLHLVDLRGKDLMFIFDMEDLGNNHLPRVKQRLPEPLTEGEINKLLGECPAKNKCMLELMYVTGLRIGEVRNLEIEKIKFEELYLEIMQEKTGIPKLTPITLNVASLIREYMDRYRPIPKPGNEKYLFINQYGNKMTNDNIWKWLGLFARKTLGKHVKPKQLRQTFATAMFLRGAKKADIVELGAWTNEKTLDHYVKAVIDRQRRSFEQFHPLGQEDAKRKGKEKQDKMIKQVDEQAEKVRKVFMELEKLRDELAG